MLKTINKASLLAATLIGCAIALPASAQQDQQRDRQQQDQRRNQQQRFAKVETQQGQTVPGDLGRVEQVNQLNLQEGDQITIIGTRARINDRPVVCARRIQSGNQQITIGREQDRGLKRVRGQIAMFDQRRHHIS